MLASLNAEETLMKRLRRETAPLHLQAEDRVRILAPDATREDYVAYLRTFHGFHAAIEARFEAHPELIATGFAPVERRRAWMIEQDLHALGAAPDSERPALPALDGLPEAIGAAYVVEGSTLGGQYLLKKFALQSVRGVATRFFEGHGERTGELWRRFGALAEACVSPSEAAACVRGAEETFRALIVWQERSS